MNNLLLNGFRGEDVVRGLASSLGLARISHGRLEAWVVVTARLVLMMRKEGENDEKKKKR